MVFFPLSSVLRRLSGCGVHEYASPETFVRPCSEEKIFIPESDTSYARCVTVLANGPCFTAFLPAYPKTPNPKAAVHMIEKLTRTIIQRSSVFMISSLFKFTI